MIKISEDILTVDELKEASGREAKDIDIEITNVAVSKVNGGRSVALNIDAKLNFVMPKKTENLMKRRIAARIASAERVRFNYTYTGIMIPKKPAGEESMPFQGSGNGGYNGGNGGNGRQYRQSKKDRPAFTNANGELVLLGDDFAGEPVAYGELDAYVGSKDKPVIEGEVFSMESMPIKSGRQLITILIASEVRTFGLKAFISEEKLKEIQENLSSGDMIRARGSIEYDTYEHQNLMMLNSVKKIEKKLKEPSLITVWCRHSRTRPRRLRSRPRTEEI